MYLEHFGLGTNPFSLSPKLDFLYKSGTFEESMAHLIYGLDNQEAIVMITGPIGTGKTMALQSFLSNLGPGFEFALVTNTRVTAVELLKLVLEDLGEPLTPGLDKSDLLIQFKDYLLRTSREGKKVLIVIDEAQNLSADVLEEIRLLTNLGQGDSQPVQIILVGQPELEAAVDRPDLAQLRQRIRVHYRLDPLDRNETAEYIDHRMTVAGADRSKFTSGAIDTIFQFTRGIPRLVNTMAGDALLSAFVAGHREVQAGDVEKDRQLAFESGPTPLSAPRDKDAPAGATFESPVPDFPHKGSPLPSAEEIIDAMPAAPPRVESPPPVQPEPAPRHVATPVDIPPRRDRRRKGSGRWWLVAVVVIAVLSGLYYLGFLDRVTAAFDRDEPATVALPPVEAEEGPVAAASQNDDAEQAVTTEVEEDPGIESPRVEEVVEESAPETAASPESEPPAEEVVTSDFPTDNIYIHVSSFRTPGRAQNMIRRMENKGISAVSLMREVRDVEWYRVYLGPFVATEEAHRAGLQLKQDGEINFYRVTRIDPNDGL